MKIVIHFHNSCATATILTRDRNARKNTMGVRKPSASLYITTHKKSNRPHSWGLPFNQDNSLYRHRDSPSWYFSGYGMPRHEYFQSFLRLGLPEIWELYQHMLEVCKRFYPIRLCTLHQRINNGTCFSAFGCIAE